MDIIRVEGGHHISGTVAVSGAKNSALKLMAATLLAPGATTLENVPNISDVHVMGKVLKRMGATIDVIDEHTLRIDTSAVSSWEAPYDLVAKMRAAGAKVDALDCLALAEEAGSSKAVNIVLMGRLSHYFDLPDEAWQSALEALVPPKFLELNRKAFQLGKNA